MAVGILTEQETEKSDVEAGHTRKRNKGHILYPEFNESPKEFTEQFSHGMSLSPN